MTLWETHRSDLEQIGEWHSQILYTKPTPEYPLRLPEWRRKRPDFDKVDHSLVRCRTAIVGQLKRSKACQMIWTDNGKDKRYGVDIPEADMPSLILDRLGDGRG